MASELAVTKFEHWRAHRQPGVPLLDLAARIDEVVRSRRLCGRFVAFAASTLAAPKPPREVRATVRMAIEELPAADIDDDLEELPPAGDDDSDLLPV